MSLQTPDCKDFIISAMRTIRKNPTNLKPGTAAGVSIKRLWAVASEVYEEAGFRIALNDLIGQEVLCASWTIGRVNSAGYSGPYCEVRLTEIPDGMPLSEHWIHRALDGKFIEAEKRRGIEHDVINQVKLHIIADGLPSRLMKSSKKNAAALAAQIIAAMDKQNKA